MYFVRAVPAPDKSPRSNMVRTGIGNSYAMGHDERAAVTELTW
jgi:hypothetical protein